MRSAPDVPPRRHQPQRQGRGRHVHRADPRRAGAAALTVGIPSRAEHERRGMTAVVDGQAACGGVDLGQHRGHELLQWCRRAAGQAGVDPPGHLGQRVHLVRDFAEHPQDVRGDLDRVQSLAPDVAHDQADAELGPGDLVQVAADPRLGCRGQVHDPEFQRPDLAGQRAQQGPLGRLGHGRDVGQPLVLPAAPGTAGRADDGHGDHRHRGDHGQFRGRGEGGGHDRGQQHHRPVGQGAARGGRTDAGQGRRHRQQGQQQLPGRGAHRGQGDQGRRRGNGTQDEPPGGPGCRADGRLSPRQRCQHLRAASYGSRVTQHGNAPRWPSGYRGGGPESTPTLVHPRPNPPGARGAPAGPGRRVRPSRSRRRASSGGDPRRRRRPGWPGRSRTS